MAIQDVVQEIFNPANSTLSTNDTDLFPSPSYYAVISDNSTSSDSGFFFSFSFWLYIIIAVVGLIIIILIVVLILFLCQRFCVKGDIGIGAMMGITKKKTKSEKSIGEICYTIDYDYASSFITLEIHRLRKLYNSKIDVLDPYCKILLTPKGTRAETCVQKKTADPVYNEVYKLKCSLDELTGSEIAIQVFHWHKFLRDAPIGECIIMLDSCDLEVGTFWKPLLPFTKIDEHLGDICLTLRYNPNTKKLSIGIMECKNLRVMNFGIGAKADPYVKLVVNVQGKTIFKDKTKVIKNNLMPYFNETFSIPISPKQLQAIEVLITVKDLDRLGINAPIGMVKLGSEPDTQSGEDQWDKMINYPRQPVTMWHTLLPCN